VLRDAVDDHVDVLVDQHLHVPRRVQHVDPAADRCHSWPVAPHRPTDSPTDSPIDVADTGIAIDEDGAAFPTVVIDVTDRPDVADLPRVHAQEGIGDIRTLVEVAGDELLLTVVVTTPVAARFSIRFSIAAHVEVLAHAAIAGHLLLATTDPVAAPDPDEAGPEPVWLAIDIDRARLAEVLVPLLDRDGL
jgi:hypothetical protein